MAVFLGVAECLFWVGKLFMLGDWRGDMKEGKRRSKLNQTEVIISMDENLITFTGAKDLDNKYQLLLDTGWISGIN